MWRNAKAHEIPCILFSSSRRHSPPSAIPRYHRTQTCTLFIWELFFFVRISNCLPKVVSRHSPFAVDTHRQPHCHCRAMRVAIVNARFGMQCSNTNKCLYYLVDGSHAVRAIAIFFSVFPSIGMLIAHTKRFCAIIL